MEGSDRFDLCDECPFLISTQYTITYIARHICTGGTAYQFKHIGWGVCQANGELLIHLGGSKLRSG